MFGVIWREWSELLMACTGSDFASIEQYFLRAPAIVAYLLGRIFAKLNAQGMSFGSNSWWSE